ncbi:hypothetical protein FS749_001456 [Ceratobasidium sp. UAMH 11750]|nr:hypothetical protein FS749_001456 [Ceratobasidium sp. UAMH 11750]
MSRLPKIRYTPYVGAITPHRSTLSSHITVIGNQTESNPRRPSFILAKAKRLSRSKLKALQQREMEKEQRQDRMTAREHADLVALQHEVSGSNEPLAPLDEDHNDDSAAPGDAWEDVDDDDEGSTSGDKPVSFEELGLPPGRTEWADRLSNEQKAWSGQIPALCDAYLAYHSGVSPTEPDDCNHMINVLCVDLAAISIQVMGKAFCDLRNVPYEKYYRDQLSAALDVYLMIEREVERRVAAALGRDDPLWRLKNACMPCTYRLQDEPPMEFSMLVTMDGNDSLKRIGEAATADHRTYESSYYLTRAQVDAFANEVQRRRKKDKDQPEETECEKRWKAARPDNDPRKRAKLSFEETGVYVSMCRHSQVLTVCDMVRSGELSKYGLATIDQLVSAFGTGILDGFDSGCSFEKTAFSGPIIGPTVRAAKFKLCTGAFHGPAHIRPCQLQYHSRLFLGAGLTDFENCETLFSSSNRLASTTRLASKYHRHQRIHRHLEGWDDDQHANVGYLLRSKYKAALAVLERAEANITRLAPDASSKKLEKFLEDEKHYLATLKVEDPNDTMAVEYISLRERLDTLQAEYDERRNIFVSHNSPNGDLRKAAATNRIEARVRGTMKQLLTLQQAVADFEEKHAISTPWTREMQEWKDAEEIRRNRDVQQCIDDLERLSVQRIFELSRAGLRGIGYKLRGHIMRAVNNRSAALKSALERYNKAVAKVGLQPMSWETLTSISVLADFDLLRGSRTGVLEQEWALPSNRRAADEYQHVKRAKEEIVRLNVEVRRIHTAIVDEQRRLLELAKDVSSPELQWAVNQKVEWRLKVNERIMRELNMLMYSNVYTGSRDTGVRVGACSNQGATQAPSPSPPSESPRTNPTGEPTTDMGEAADKAPEVGADDEACDIFDRVHVAFESVSL